MMEDLRLVKIQAEYYPYPVSGNHGSHSHSLLIALVYFDGRNWRINHGPQDETKRQTCSDSTQMIVVIKINFFAGYEVEFVVSGCVEIHTDSGRSTNEHGGTLAELFVIKLPTAYNSGR